MAKCVTCGCATFRPVHEVPPPLIPLSALPLPPLPFRPRENLLYSLSPLPFSLSPLPLPSLSTPAKHLHILTLPLPSLTLLPLPLISSSSALPFTLLPNTLPYLNSLPIIPLTLSITESPSSFIYYRIPSPSSHLPLFLNPCLPFVSSVTGELSDSLI